MRSILILLLLQISIYSQTVSKVGTTAAGFLNIDIGARATGMGSAFVAIADDATGTYWNPAGLGFQKGINVNSTYSPWVKDINLFYHSVILRKEKWGALGISSTQLEFEEMERTTISQPEGTGEMFDASSRALGITYSNNIIGYVSFGTTFKYIREKIYHSVANGYAFDIGVLGKIPISNLRLGMSYSNYGTKMKMDGRDLLTTTEIDPNVDGNNESISAKIATDSYELPEIFRFGIAIDPLEKLNIVGLNIAFDGVDKKNGDLIYNLGAEFGINMMIFPKLDLMFFFRTGRIDVFENQGERRRTYGIGTGINIANIVVINYDYSECEMPSIADPIIHSFGVKVILK